MILLKDVGSQLRHYFTIECFFAETSCGRVKPLRADDLTIGG